MVKFLRLNQIDKYNNGRGDVYVADQFRGVYRMDRWVRNHKWRWSMLFWSLGKLLTKAYKLYLRMCEEKGEPPKEYKEQYALKSIISEHWICTNHIKTAAEESSTTMGSRT